MILHTFSSVFDVLYLLLLFIKQLFERCNINRVIIIYTQYLFRREGLLSCNQGRVSGALVREMLISFSAKK